MLTLERVDEKLECKDCHREYVFGTEEREEFARQGHYHAPSRCPSCRAARRARHEALGIDASAENGRRDAVNTRRQASRPPRVAIVCAACGRPAEVPFVPRRDRPVYCSECYAKVRSQRLGAAS